MRHIAYTSILAIFIIILFSFGCDKNELDTNQIGKWMVTGTYTIHEDSLEVISGNINHSLELKSNGSGKVIENNGEMENFDWIMSGNKIDLTQEGVNNIFSTSLGSFDILVDSENYQEWRKKASLASLNTNGELGVSTLTANLELRKE